MSITLAAVIAGGVAIPIAGGYALWKSERRREAKLTALAKELKLSYEARGRVSGETGSRQHILRGEYRGMTLLIFQRVVKVGKTSVAYTVAQTEFSPPLRMGLSVVSPRSFMGAVRNKGLAIGNKDFDKRHEVTALEEVQAKNLFASGLHETLMRAKECSVSIADDGLELKIKKSLSDGAVRKILAHTETVHHAILEARRNMPRSQAEIEIIESWAGFALQEGLRFDAQKFAMVGKVGRFDAEVRLSVDPKEKWQTHFFCKFPRPMEAELRVVNQPSGIEAAKTFLSRLDEIKLGDDRFDKTFWIGGHPKERVATLLQEDVRVKLMELAEDAREFELADHHLSATFSGRMVDEMLLVRTLRSFAGLCENVFEHATDQSQYR